MSSPLLWGPNNISNNLQNQILLANGTLLNSNGPKNYITYNNFENAVTTGWSLGTIGTLTNGLPTGSPTFGSGASGNLSISIVSSGQLAGNYSLSYASSAATTAGNMLASDAITIDSEYQAKVLTWRFAYKASVNPNNGNFSGTSSNSFAVAVYDVTNSVFLGTAGQFNIVQNSGVGICTGTFQTNSTTASLRFIVYNANASSGAITMLFDDFYLGPQPTAIAPAVGDWKSYTPTGSWTTNTTYAGQWRRVGDSMQIWAQASISGTPTLSTPFNISLPSGYSIDTTKLAAASGAVVCGMSTMSSAGALYFGDVNVAPLVSTTVVYVYSIPSASGNSHSITSVTNANPATFTTNDYINVLFTVPISGWSSSAVSSADTDSRIITSAMSSNTTYSATSGAVIPFTTTTYDLSGSLTLATGRFTAPVTGYYDVQFSGWNRTTGSGNSVILYKNGSSVQALATFSAALFNISGTVQIQLNAGDYVDLRVDGSFTLGSGFNVSFTRRSGPAVVQATETVAMQAQQTAGQTINNATFTFVNFNSVVYDTHNTTTTGASWKYTAPVRGYYRVTSKVIFNATWPNNTTSNLQLALLKNQTLASGTASLILNDRRGFPNEPFPQVLGSGTVLLNAGDYIQISAYQASGSNLALTTDGASNYICVERVPG